MRHNKRVAKDEDYAKLVVGEKQLKCKNCKKARIRNQFCLSCGDILFQHHEMSLSETLFEYNIEYVYPDGSTVLMTGMEYMDLLTPREKARVHPNHADEEFSHRYCENPMHQECGNCGRVGLGDASWHPIRQFYCDDCDNIVTNWHSAASDETCGKEFEWHRETAESDS
jgi:uncharacterized protein YlaI